VNNGRVGEQGFNDLSGRLWVEPDQVMGHSGLITEQIHSTSHYSILRSCTVTHCQLLVGQVSIRYQTACKAYQLGWEKQPAKADHLNLGDFVKFDTPSPYYYPYHPYNTWVVPHQMWAAVYQ